MIEIDEKIDSFNIDLNELSDDFLTEYSDKIDWTTTSLKIELNDYNIEKYADKLDWDTIYTQRHLSEDFIIKHIDKINYAWWIPLQYQVLSESFLLDNIESIGVINVILHRYKPLSFKFLEKFVYEFNLYEASIKTNNINIQTLISMYQYKYNIDKLAYELNK